MGSCPAGCVDGPIEGTDNHPPTVAWTHLHQGQPTAEPQEGVIHIVNNINGNIDSNAYVTACEEMNPEIKGL